jgi:hypothetical protein
VQVGRPYGSGGPSAQRRSRTPPKITDDCSGSFSMQSTRSFPEKQRPASPKTSGTRTLGTGENPQTSTTQSVFERRIWDPVYSGETGPPSLPERQWPVKSAPSGDVKPPAVMLPRPGKPHDRWARPCAESLPKRRSPVKQNEDLTGQRRCSRLTKLAPSDVVSVPGDDRLNGSRYP